MQFYGHAEKVEDRAKDQIEYVNEDRWVREKFENELAQRELTSLMPPEAYSDPSFECYNGEVKPEEASNYPNSELRKWTHKTGVGGMKRFRVLD